MKRKFTIVFIFYFFVCIIGCHDYYENKHGKSHSDYWRVWEQNRYSIEGKGHWNKIESFIKIYNSDNILAFCNKKLEEYYNCKEDMTGWEKVTEAYEDRKANLLNCFAAIEEITKILDKMEDSVVEKQEMERKVDQSRIALNDISKVFPPFENKMNNIKAKKENELKNRKNEINSIKQSKRHELTYSDSDVKIEMTDVFINRYIAINAPSIQEKDIWNEQFGVVLTLTVINENKIVRPKTGVIYSSEHAYRSKYNTDVIIVDPVVSIVPKGIAITDIFGNTYAVTKINPYYGGGDIGRGIKPNESEIFIIRTNEVPLKNTEAISVNIAVGTLGNTQNIEFIIPQNIIKMVLEETM